jgi:hypothetical protein
MIIKLIIYPIFTNISFWIRINNNNKQFALILYMYYK